MEHVNPHVDIYNVLARYVPASQMDILLQELRAVDTFWDSIHHSTTYIIKQLGAYHTTITSYPGGSVGPSPSPGEAPGEEFIAAVYGLLGKYISAPILEVFANELRVMLLGRANGEERARSVMWRILYFHRARAQSPSIAASEPSCSPIHSAPTQADVPPPLPPEPAPEGISISDSSLCFWCVNGEDRMTGRCECA